MRAEFDRRYGPKAKVLQIVLRSEADAEDVIKKLNLGADFVEMARDVSVDNVSRRKGGEIPPLGRGSPLGDAAFKLKPGQFSDAGQDAGRLPRPQAGGNDPGRGQASRGREGRDPGKPDRRSG